jgi:hypothetical protein
MPIDGLGCMGCFMSGRGVRVCVGSVHALCCALGTGTAGTVRSARCGVGGTLAADVESVDAHRSRRVLSELRCAIWLRRSM